MILRRIAHHLEQQQWTAVLIEIAEDLRADKAVFNQIRTSAEMRIGGMQKIRDRRISRQLQACYPQFDELDELTNFPKQVRAAGVTQGYPLGLSAFGAMDPDQLIAIVRGSPAYSAYLRANREWAAIYLGAVDQQQQRALRLHKDIDQYPGKGDQ